MVPRLTARRKVHSRFFGAAAQHRTGGRDADFSTIIRATARFRTSTALRGYRACKQVHQGTSCARKND